MKIGDLIKTYHKGYYEITKIQGALVYYKMRYTSTGRKMNGGELRCNIGFCEPASEFILKEIRKHNEEIARLQKIVWPIL